MKFTIITLGCKVNAYESNYIKESLLNNGFSFCNEISKADIVIVNTCSVTDTSDKKSYKLIRRIKRENPEAILVVCGCSSQNNFAKYQNMGINILLGNVQKSAICNLIQNYLKDHQNYEYHTIKRDLPFENMAIKSFDHVRAYIKVQDGCNNFCSYCIIPYTRGDIRSKDFDKVIDEAKTLVSNNHKEIVLTGIHTGSYNCNGLDLSDLIVELSKIDGLERIRISSIEITELDDKFLNVLKTNQKVANHLHIPLQSGSDNVLKRMNRKYDKNYFREKINKIRSIRENIAITTDAIVGHPYETDEDFLEYLEFCREINFQKIHVFPYSLRNGTAASHMPQVDGNIKKERSHKLLELSEKLEEEYLKKQIGLELDVLTEEVEDGFIVGHTSNYLKVYLEGDYKLNMLYKCKIKEIKNKKLIGEIISCVNV